MDVSDFYCGEAASQGTLVKLRDAVLELVLRALVGDLAVRVARVLQGLPPEKRGGLHQHGPPLWAEITIFLCELVN